MIGAYLVPIIRAVAYLTYQTGRNGRTLYVHIRTSIWVDGRVRTKYLGYLGRLDGPGFPKRLRAAERKYGPLNLKRRPRRKRK